MYSKYKSFIRYKICKYLLPILGLYFHSLNGLLEHKTLNFNKVWDYTLKTTVLKPQKFKKQTKTKPLKNVTA